MLVFVVAVWFVYEVRSTLTLVLFSVFFAYLLEPLVLRIERSLSGATHAAWRSWKPTSSAAVF